MAVSGIRSIRRHWNVGRRKRATTIIQRLYSPSDGRTLRQVRPQRQVSILILPLSVTRCLIEMIAFEQYFHVLLFIMLYKVFLILTERACNRVLSQLCRITESIQWTNQNSKQIHAAEKKRGKTCANESRMVFVNV